MIHFQGKSFSKIQKMGKFLKLKLVRSQNWNKIENFLIFNKIMAVLSGFLDVRSTNWATLLVRELSKNCGLQRGVSSNPGQGNKKVIGLLLEMLKN